MKISLVSLLLLLFLTTLVYALFLDGASQANAYMERFEFVIRKLGHKEYSIPYRFIEGSSIEPNLSNNLQDILQELEEIVDNTIY